MESDDIISPEKAIEMLRKDGIVVDRAQARIIVNFLAVIAEIVVEQYLENPK